VQPVYVHSNVYSSGANAWNREGDALDANGVAAHLEEQKDGSVVMTLSVPEELSSHVVDRISTSDLGTPRIVEAEYENPDGSPLIFDKDICGEEREQRAVPGPFANLKAGEQRMMVWAWTQGAL
jgi:CTP:molybdopterin cytidylyltransferase MocA